METSVATINKVFREWGGRESPRARIYNGEILGLTLGVTVSYACNSAAPFPLLFSDPPLSSLLPPLCFSHVSLSHSVTHTHTRVDAKKPLTNYSWKQGNYCDH